MARFSQRYLTFSLSTCWALISITRRASFGACHAGEDQAGAGLVVVAALSFPGFGSWAGQRRPRAAVPQPVLPSPLMGGVAQQPSAGQVWWPSFMATAAMVSARIWAWWLRGSVPAPPVG